MENKIAVITGAYSGLGSSLSKILAKKGYKLVIGGRNRNELKKFASELKKITNIKTVVMDVRKKKDCEKIIKTAVKEFGQIDILINNAGIWRMANIDEVTERDINDMFKINTFGPIYCSQAAVMVMRKQGFGHILNIGSTSSIDYKTSHIAYGSSKSALIGFTGCLRTELEGTGIRVSVFSPGGMKTKLFRTKPERMKDNFMEPDFVAEKIMQHIDNSKDEWNVTLRRPQ
jgi:uncharacterized protein